MIDGDEEQLCHDDDSCQFVDATTTMLIMPSMMLNMIMRCYIMRIRQALWVVEPFGFSHVHLLQDTVYAAAKLKAREYTQRLVGFVRIPEVLSIIPMEQQNGHMQS